jgi:osmotically-inducible protein OsmY
MKTDTQLKADISDELAWDLAINAAPIGVAVKDGVVTLTGQLTTFAEKYAVQRAVQRVGGVRGIAIDLEVQLAPEHKRSDAEIAEAAISAMRWHSMVPDERVKVEVESGWVTLTGELDWGYQYANAEQAIQPLLGVRGVTNLITIKPRVSAKDLGTEITAALTRQAEREAHHINVEVEGGIVTLSGKVHSMAEHDAAIGTAFSARGVSRVVDHLRVGA